MDDFWKEKQTHFLTSTNDCSHLKYIFCVFIIVTNTLEKVYKHYDFNICHYISAGSRDVGLFEKTPMHLRVRKSGDEPGCERKARGALCRRSDLSAFLCIFWSPQYSFSSSTSGNILILGARSLVEMWCSFFFFILLQTETWLLLTAAPHNEENHMKCLNGFKSV